MKPDPTAFVDNAFAGSLAAPGIALGYLDTIGRRDSSPLLGAIQAADAAGSARARESMDRLSRSEGDLAGQAMKNAQAKYAADGNARMQLLQKSNEIADNLGKLRGEYGFDMNSPKDKARMENLLRQKEQIGRQLETATQAVVNSQLYQGETLVNPVDDFGASHGTASADTEKQALLSEFLASKISGLDSKSLINLSADDVKTAFRQQYPDHGFTDSDLTDAFNRKKKEAVDNHIARIDEEKRQIDLHQKRAEAELAKITNSNNVREALIKQILGSDEFNSITSKARTKEELIAASKGFPKFIQKIATQLKTNEIGTVEDILSSAFEFFQRKRPIKNEELMH